jgi:hypothetical protein
LLRITDSKEEDRGSVGEWKEMKKTVGVPLRLVEAGLRR